MSRTGWITLIVVLLVAIVAAFGIWKIVKHRSGIHTAVVGGREGQIKLSPADTEKSRRLIPTLPGQSAPGNPMTGPASIQRELQTIRDVQRINEMNKRNSK
jgi:hypothetical protein